MSRLTWYGHGCFQLETAGQTILIDPFFTGNPSAPVGCDEIHPNHVIVSHGHADHVGDTVEISRRTGALVISNYEITEWLSRQGVPHVHPLNIGGSRQFQFGRVKFTIAHHTSSLPDGSYGGAPAGILLTLNDGRKLYHACDTGLFSDMNLIGDEGIELAILPIGDNFTMGPEDALKATQFLRPRKVIPAHFNTWDIISQDANAWAEEVRRNTPAEPIVLAPGQSYVI